jgi:glycosyltransferase involved in cell wall biosynthesis
MQTLMLNNFNYLRGGAETVFLSEVALLKKQGHRVAVFSRQHPDNLPAQFERFFPSEMITDTLSPSAKGLRSLLGLFYSLESKKCLNAMLQETTGDVAHVHNIYGRLTTSILNSLFENRIPVVMTLHDYKLICPNYKLMHHGKICEDCRGNRFYNPILNRCHKNSLIASTVYALETYFNHIFNQYRKKVRCFISPSKFLKAKLIEFGWPEQRIEYIPNFLSTTEFDPNYLPGDYFLYFGRLSSEKGIETLIKAFCNLKHANIQLKIAGEGPLEQKLKISATSDERIFFSGYLSGAPLAEMIRNARCVVVPSEWYENAPLSVLEAMAYGKPVIGARIGGIPEMIDDGQNGLLFASGDTRNLTQAMSTLIEMDDATLTDMGRSARRKVEVEYNSDLHYERLIDIYARSIRECGVTPSQRESHESCSKLGSGGVNQSQ